VHDASQGKLPSDAVGGICTSGAGLFVATGAGVALFDGTNWVTLNEANSALLSDDVETIRELPGGDIYMCTRGAGISALKP
jgi:hypothetical protein